MSDAEFVAEVVRFRRQARPSARLRQSEQERAYWKDQYLDNSQHIV